MERLSERHRAMNIYLDESGDLGFSFPASSTYITLACISTPNPRALKKAIRRVSQKMGHKTRIEFKAKRDSWQVRQRLLSVVREQSIEIREISIYKPNVYPTLKHTPNLLYNYAAGLLLVPYLKQLPMAHLVVDRRELKVAKAPFQLDGYLSWRLLEVDAPTKLTISHEESFVSPGVQMADVVANAIWRCRERDDRRGYNLIAPCLQRSQLLFASGT